jgi:hypothetical protein
VGSSNNAAGQNQAAQAQVAQNTQNAQSALAAYLKSNPSVLAGAPSSIAGPQQFSGVQSATPPAGASGAMPQQQARPPMQGQPQMRAPQPPAQSGAPGQAPQPPLPPGLLALLRPQ